MDNLSWNLRAIFLVLTLLGTSPAGAQSDRVETMKVELAAAWFEEPDDRALVRVVEMEERVGRKFTPEEVAAAVEDLTGESLKRNCFTCVMRVLTPNGYVAIENLRVGHTVYSWDERINMVVHNRIVQIHTANSEIFGRLHGTPTGVPLEVSPHHPFLLPEEGLYSRIGEVEPANLLRGINHAPSAVGTGCDALLVRRGEYAVEGQARVMTLTVEKEPHNFIVEGLVVHNKPVQIL